MGCIYKVTCLVGKQRAYIGMTMRPLDARWRAHCADARRGSKGLLHRAIRKYGADNFSVKEIKVSFDWEKLCTSEVYYIRKFDTLYPGGYNLQTGGKQGLHTDRTKLKMADARKKYMAVPENRKRVGAASSKTKSSPEGRAVMRAAALKSWETRRARFTPEEIAAAIRNGRPEDYDQSLRTKLSWIGRRQNGTDTWTRKPKMHSQYARV